MVQKRKKGNGDTFREITREFYRAHGIESPSIYLAQRGNLLYGSMYYIYKQADKGIGTGGLDPKTACWLLQQAEDILREDEILEVNPIEKFLRPQLEKFYKEQERIKNAAKSAKR